MAEDQKINLTELTVDLLSAFVSNNNVRSEDLPALIGSTHAALVALDAPQTTAQDEPQDQWTPAVSARKSLGSREHIISMIDGKPYKTLRRHLSTHGLTPEDYRARYNLSANYPMVAPAYSEHRREMAKKIGLGRKGSAASRSGARKPRAK